MVVESAGVRTGVCTGICTGVILRGASKLWWWSLRGSTRSPLDKTFIHCTSTGHEERPEMETVVEDEGGGRS